MIYVYCRTRVYGFGVGVKFKDNSESDGIL